jgi:nucleotide-binding universal stress UspA family protein
MYKQILAALDDSPRAPEVLRHAAGLAAHTGARLHLCHAVNVPLGLPTDAWMLSFDELQARLLDHAKHSLAGLVDQLRPPATPIHWGDHLTRIGRPAQVIVDLAVDLNVELIVIGSHGYGPLDRLLGTTAARVVNSASVSVLVVRPSQA